MAYLRTVPRWWPVLLVGLLAWLGLPAWAESDPPARVGRLVPLQGAVSVLDNDGGGWVAATHNLPLTSGDRVATAAGARAELRIGSTVLRLAGASDLEIQRIDDGGLVFELHGGSLALRTRSNEVAAAISVVTQEATLRLLRSGSWRIDRHDVTTLAASQRGELVVEGAGGWVVGSGRRIELWRDGNSRELRQAWAAPANDEFASWLAGAERDDDRAAAYEHVSPEMTGAEDLDRHGRWERHPEHGVVWLPHSVAVGWAPYTQGRWAWVRPWGWTWVDAAPWGFAPFHYGRWVSWGGRWCWSPGPYVARPVFAPALVRWVGAPPPHWHGGPKLPPAGWVPLAPHETYQPVRPVAPQTPFDLERRRPAPPRPGTAQVFTAAPGAAVPIQRGHPAQPPVSAPPMGPVPVPAPVAPRPVPPPPQAVAPRPAATAPPVVNERPPNAVAGPVFTTPAEVRTRQPEPRNRGTARQLER